jgi:hypothetical protein
MPTFRVNTALVAFPAHFRLGQGYPTAYSSKMGTIFCRVKCALFYIENYAEIFPAHYTWKVAEKEFKMAFMMNKLAMIKYCEIILEKNCQKSLRNLGADYTCMRITLDKIQ